MEQFSFLITNEAKEPLYLQLYQCVKEEICSGRVKAGEKLPSKRNVRDHLGISVNTVESAYEQLEAEGYIEARDRSGFYVCPMEAAPLALHPAQETVAEEPAPEDAQFSFDTANVDTQFFPYATWSRLSKNLMYGHREYLELGDNRGDLSLRQALCDLLHQMRGVNCSPDQVVIGAGSEYLLSLLVTLLGKDKVYGMENPCYAKTYQILKRTGAQVHLIPLDQNGLSLRALEKVQPDVLHITPSHQFPMGVIMPVSRRNDLLNWAAENDRFLIEDEYDSEFRYAGRPIPALQGLDENDRVIYLSTFSKSISPSFRLSVLVLPRPLALRYRQMFAAYSSTVSRYEQHTLEQFIAGGHFERHLNKLRKVYKTRKERLEQALSSIPGGQIIGANAGLHFVFRLPGREEAELVEAARRAGIRLAGLSDCYPQGKALCPDGAVVLGYASLHEEAITAAAALLKQAWK